MTPEFGAATQLEKIDMLDFADIVALNKFDKRGALDAIRDVKKQYKRNHQLWEAKDEDIPVFGTIASQFNDPGTNTLYKAIMDKVVERTGTDLHSSFTISAEMSEKIYIIPPSRTRYLSEISENNRGYDKWVAHQAEVADRLYSVHRSIETIESAEIKKVLRAEFDRIKLDLDPKNWLLIEGWPKEAQRYKDEFYIFKVRDKEIKVKTHTESLSHLQIPKVSTPKFRSWGDQLSWLLQENVPGRFPFAAGVYPFKRTGEDPTRMFAGEGGPERTNRASTTCRSGQPYKRLSTAFDSVTLYGDDPALRPTSRQGRQRGRVDLHARRCQAPLLGLRPVRPGDVGVDDHQRPGPDAARVLPERGDRPAVRTLAAQNGKVDEANATIDALFRERHAAAALPRRTAGRPQRPRHAAARTSPATWSCLSRRLREDPQPRTLSTWCAARCRPTS
jgi:hypothetical protein